MASSEKGSKRSSVEPSPIPISVQDRRRLCALAGCDDRTVKRFYRGQVMKPTVQERIADAARALGFSLPPSAPASRGGW